MIRIEGSGDHAPTRRLAAALHAAAPDLMTARDLRRADLTVVPRSTDPAAPGPHTTGAAWYDLVWTYPALSVDAAPENHDDGEDVGGAVYWRVRWVPVSRAGTLPPPSRIGFEERLAAAPPVTLDRFAEQEVAFLGGPEGALRAAAAHREAVVREDRSADVYDWPALAVAAAEKIRGMAPPRLTAGQRARVAAVRLFEAHQAVDAARSSVRALVANARAAGGDEDLVALEGLLERLDPGLGAVVSPRAGGAVR